MPGVTAAAFDPKLADSPTAAPNLLLDRFSTTTITLLMLISVWEVVKFEVAIGLYVLCGTACEGYMLAERGMVSLWDEYFAPNG